jgi:hypothetical protein
MTQPTCGGGKAHPKDFGIQILCPLDHPAGQMQPTGVPSRFSASGDYGLSFDHARTSAGSVSVECVASYGAGGATVNLCKVCILDTQQLTWCCQFDLSAAPPAESAPIQLTARLYNDKHTVVLAVDSKGVVYQSTALDPCSCPGPGTPCA